MHRSLLPVILMSLGFTLVALAINMPLFEWQVSEIVTDFPSDVHFNPSPWTTQLGESLDDDSYIRVRLPNGRIPCRPERLTSVVRRSWNDETVERIALNFNQTIVPWLSEWNKFGFVLLLCGIYSWWFILWQKRPVSEALISTVVVVILFAILINIWRLFLHKIGSPVCLELQGTVTINAKLLKVHYETLIVLLASTLAELGALGIILRQIIRAVIERKDMQT